MTDPSPLDSDELDRLRELERAATPGPWHDYDPDEGTPQTNRFRQLDCGNKGMHYTLWPDDARFVAAARNALPALLDAIAAARARADAAWALIEQWVEAEDAARGQDPFSMAYDGYDCAYMLRAALTDIGAFE